MIRSTRSFASQATTTFTPIPNPTNNIQRIRLVVNPPTPILTSSPFPTFPPVSNHNFAIPAPVRRAGVRRVANSNVPPIAPATILPDPTPARWVNAGRVAMGNTVPSVFSLPGVPVINSRVSAAPTPTVINSPATPVTTSTAVPATIHAATLTTTFAPTPPVTITAAIPPSTSSATPPRPIRVPRPIRAARGAGVHVDGRTGDDVGPGGAGENGEEERDDDDDVRMEIDWRYGDLEYMEVDWWGDDMDVDIVPPNATSSWF